MACPPLTDWDSHRPEIIIANTDQMMTAADLAEELKRWTRPVNVESEPLGCNPDDYPLF